MSDTQWYAVWPDPRSRSRRVKSCENGWFQSLSPLSICMWSNYQIVLVNCDTPRQCINFVWTEFWYSSLFGVTWLPKLACYEESAVSSVLGWLIYWFCLVIIIVGWLRVEPRSKWMYWWKWIGRQIFTVVEMHLGSLVSLVDCSWWYEDIVSLCVDESGWW